MAVADIEKSMKDNSLSANAVRRRFFMTNCFVFGPKAFLTPSLVEHAKMEASRVTKLVENRNLPSRHRTNESTIIRRKVM